MQRFILEQNITSFKLFLAEKEREVASRDTVEMLLAAAHRELAILNAIRSGAYAGLAPDLQKSLHLDPAKCDLRRFQADFESAGLPYLLLDPRPGLHIVDVNDAYAKVTLIARDKVASEKLFDVFPDNPDDPLADGVSNLYASLYRAQATREADRMRVQRYDVRGADGTFIERHWQPVNTPIFDAEGRLIYLLHHVEAVPPPR